MMKKLIISFGESDSLKVKNYNQYTEIFIDKNYTNWNEKIFQFDSKSDIIKIINNIVSEDKYDKVKKLILNMPNVYNVNVNKFKNLE